MEKANFITNKTPTPTPTYSPNTIKRYIPVKNHLPTPMPSPGPGPTYASPTCTDMCL